MEGVNLKFTPATGRRLLMPFKHVWTYGWHFWGPYIASPNGPNGRCNPPPAFHPTPPPVPPPTAHPPP